jgi:hypothetical protein
VFLSPLHRHCFLTQKDCDISTDFMHPSCFVSIPFHLENEMMLIKDTLESLGVKPAISDKKPPQFLFHDVCDKLSRCLFGVFEVTENNENVFTEYGMMVEQGKPAILLYDETRRKRELSSNMKGILQTRYATLSEITPKLSETIFTLPEKMSSPDGSILRVVLQTYRLAEELQEGLERKGLKVISCNKSLKCLEDASEYIKYAAEITLMLSDGDNVHTFSVSPKLQAQRSMIRTGIYEVSGVHFIQGAVSPGQLLVEKIQKIKKDIEDVLLYALEKIEQS